MKFLYDQNLSNKLVHDLEDLYPESLHVRDIGMRESDDSDIWGYAAQHGYIIVSKDSDFHQRSFLHGHPPKVIWLRVGNCSTRTILFLLRTHHDAILRFEQSETASFLTLE
jgi:predicted nuclease of predicted toxin-antitoxin system